MSKILRSAERTFDFHPRCKTIKLSHLCLADDLMLFCKGNISSIRVLCNCVLLFSHSSGLQASSAKSAIYIAGVPSDLREEIRSIS